MLKKASSFVMSKTHTQRSSEQQPPVPKLPKEFHHPPQRAATDVVPSIRRRTRSLGTWELMQLMQQRMQLLERDVMGLRSEKSIFIRPEDISPPKTVIREPDVTAIEPFYGHPDNVKQFVGRMYVRFLLQPHTYSSQRSKVLTMIDHLRGLALEWGMLIIDGPRSELLDDFTAFVQALREQFDDPNLMCTMRQQGMHLEQKGSVSAYSIVFESIMYKITTTKDAWGNTFFHGLTAEVVKEMPWREISLDDYEAVKREAMRADWRLKNRKKKA